MVTIRSSQKLFTLDEVARLTGIGGDNILNVARAKHLGFISRVAEAAGEQAEQWLFTAADVMILNVLNPRREQQA